MNEVLKKKIRDKYGTLKKFSTEIGIPQSQLYNKLNGSRPLTKPEQILISMMLEEDVTMSRTELKLMAIRSAELWKEGIIGMSPHGAENTPSVQVRSDDWEEFSQGEKIEKDGEWESFTEDGVRFFSLVRGEEDEEGMLNG